MYGALSDAHLLVRASVLVVDDAQAAREQIRARLRRLGLGRVAFSADGASAFGDLHAIKPDLLIADARLAPLDGFELTSLIRETAQDQLARVPVILLAPGSTPEEVQRARAVGADDVYVEPLGEKQLRARILRLFRAREREGFAGMPTFAKAGRKGPTGGPRAAPDQYKASSAGP